MKRKLWLVSAALVLVLPLVNFLLPKQALAATNLTESDIKTGTLDWVNRATIMGTFGGSTLYFFDKDIGDDDYNYKVRGYDCFGEIDLKSDSNGPTTFNTVNLDIDIVPPGAVGVDCRDL